MADFEDPPTEDPDYPVYDGERKCCSQCGRQFQWGDLIAVSIPDNGALTFCFPDLNLEEGSAMPCMAMWVFENGRAMGANIRKFGGD